MCSGWNQVYPSSEDTSTIGTAMLGAAYDNSKAVSFDLQSRCLGCQAEQTFSYTESDGTPESTNIPAPAIYTVGVAGYSDDAAQYLVASTLLQYQPVVANGFVAGQPEAAQQLYNFSTNFSGLRTVLFNVSFCDGMYISPVQALPDNVQHQVTIDTST